MNKRTTEQWAELLAAATPGPWVRSENPWEPHDVRTVDQERWIAMTKDESEGLDRDALADTYLVAAAPEAVAEVVRLRRAFEEFIGELNDDLAHEGIEDYGDIDDVWPSMQEYGELTVKLAHRNILTHILEGHNDGGIGK